jgi:hypothetical protein
MVSTSQHTRSLASDVAASEPQRTDWLRASLLSGFVATFALTATVALGYAIAKGIGNRDGNTIERWFYGLTDNKLTDDISDRFLLVMLANLVFGLAWSLAYGRLVASNSRNSGWRSGAMFSIIPWILSVTVFFPIAGAGFLGNDLDAGPMPVIGNLIIHLMFGAVLGSMYAIDMETGLDGSSGDSYAAATAERGAAIGIAAGGVVGAIGGWFMADQFDSLASQPVIALAGALSAAAIGALVGSLVGMADEAESRAKSSQTIKAKHVRESMQRG